MSAGPSGPETPLPVVLIDRGLTHLGGVPKVILSFAKYADRRLIRTHVASLKPHTSDMGEAFDRLGVPLHELGDHGYLRPALALRRQVHAHGFRLLVANTLKSYLVAKVAALGTPAKVVFWLHGVNEIRSSRAKTAMFAALSRHDSLIFVSNATRHANLPSSHAGSDHVIYNGVEPPCRDPQWAPYDRARRPEFGFDPQDFVIVSTGSFEDRKNQRVLVRAFDALHVRFPQARLVLIGRGELLDEVRALAASLPSRDRIHFLGTRPDARRLLGLADLYVHPAYGEAFGLVVVEAMLAGVPVIAANADALPELVQDGETGLLFDTHDPQDLARVMARVITHPDEARRLSEAARVQAETRFSVEHFAEEASRVLLLEARRLPRRPVWHLTRPENA